VPRSYFTRAAQRAGTEVGVVRTNQKAAELAPVIAELRAAGITSKKGIAKGAQQARHPDASGRRRVAGDTGRTSAGATAGMMARSPRSASPEDEAAWLRARVIRLRVALRFVKDPRVEVILREVIADAEDRLVALDQPPT
jgi:hypothetical protein